MLPSGNDAGFLLADYFGRMLKRVNQTRIDQNKAKSESSDKNLGENATDVDTTSSKDTTVEDPMFIDENEKSKYLHRYSLFRYTYVKYFLMEMNYYAREELKLGATNFDSPHGMSNRYVI